MTERAPAGRSRWPAVALLAGLAVAAQLWGLYGVTGPPSPAGFAHADKLGHGLGFALPVALLLLALGLRRLAAGRRPSRRTLLGVVAVFAAHAVLSEVVQHTFLAGRTGDPLDALADGTGVALGALAAVRLLRRAGRPAPAAPAPGRARSRAGAA